MECENNSTQIGDIMFKAQEIKSILFRRSGKKIQNKNSGRTSSAATPVGTCRIGHSEFGQMFYYYRHNIIIIERRVADF